MIRMSYVEFVVVILVAHLAYDAIKAGVRYLMRRGTGAKMSDEKTSDDWAGEFGSDTVISLLESGARAEVLRVETRKGEFAGAYVTAWGKEHRLPIETEEGRRALVSASTLADQHRRMLELLNDFDACAQYDTGLQVTPEIMGRLAALVAEIDGVKP